MKSGNFNFLEPSGPLQACNGTDLLHCLSFPCPYDINALFISVVFLVSSFIVESLCFFPLFSFILYFLYEEPFDKDVCWDKYPEIC